MNKKSIHQVAADVIAKAGTPLSAQQIYETIIRDGSYEFKAKDPVSILRSQLRKHCVGAPSG